MAKPTNTFALGLTVIVILVLFFGALIFIGGSSLFGPPTHDFAVRYPVAAPLPDEIKPGAAVFCGLHQVGKVEDITLKSVRGSEAPETETLYVYLKVSVQRKVQLRSDCRILARGPLLGGGGKLVIADPGATGEILSPGSVIDGAAGGTFDSALETLAAEIDPSNPVGLMALIKTELDSANARSLLAKVHRSVEDLNAITANISHQMDAREKDVLIAKLDSILDNVNAATAALRAELQPGTDGVLVAKVHQGLDSLNAGLAGVVDLLDDNRPKIDDTLANIQSTTDTLDRRIATPIAEQLDVLAQDSLLAKLHVSFDSLNQSLADLNVTSNKTRELIVLNKDRVDEILANVSETSIHLKAASKELRLSPWRLIYKPSRAETRQDTIFSAARSFAEAAAHLDDSSTQLRALVESREGQIAADDPDVQRIRARLQKSFEEFSSAEEALWDELTEDRR